MKLPSRALLLMIPGLTACAVGVWLARTSSSPLPHIFGLLAAGFGLFLFAGGLQVRAKMRAASESYRLEKSNSTMVSPQ